MKTRDARAIQKQVEGLILERRFDDAIAMIRAPSGALLHPRFRNIGVRILLLQGKIEEAEAELVTAVIEDPANMVASSCLLGLHKNIPQSDEALARYLDLAMRTESCIIWARVCAMQLARSDTELAYDTAKVAVKVAPDTAIGSSLSQMLAALFFWYGRLDLADALILASEAFRHPFGAIHALSRLRKGTLYDEATRSLFMVLASIASPYQAEGRRALFDFRWVTEGPTAELLEDSYAWRHDGQDIKLKAEQIALATELGRTDEAVSLLKQAPECAALYDKVLPLASILSETRSNAMEIDREHVDEMAALNRRLERNTAKLRAIVSDASHSIAVVGNSACERGSGNGAAIDACNTVVRFNRGHSHPALAADYGSRTDIHVLPIRNENEGAPASGAKMVLFTTPYALNRNRDWTNVRRLDAQGFDVACIPGRSFTRLVSELKAPPSNGLRVCAYLEETRAPESETRPFGFSFVDQIGPERTSSHYFETANPSSHHNWTGERAVFDRLFHRQA